ncbi:hypothetical protein DUI87_16664 [Hirundo rustica rustica]|uniref:Uncharacterized protein n=1 Tax=Hirundo rustica rustica TaxID=333673 RepID=A0A3M0K2H8_HIRRU|nr:hypothetical protein DUI87_16664 [Hirundo rustica rustica]
MMKKYEEDFGNIDHLDVFISVLMCLLLFETQLEQSSSLIKYLKGGCSKVGFGLFSQAKLVIEWLSIGTGSPANGGVTIPGSVQNPRRRGTL